MPGESLYDCGEEVHLARQVALEALIPSPDLIRRVQLNNLAELVIKRFGREVDALQDSNQSGDEKCRAANRGSSHMAMSRMTDVLSRD